MLRTRVRSGLIDLLISAAGGFSLGLLLTGALHVTHVRAESQSANNSPPQHAAAAPTARMFGSDAGLVLNFIKPDKTADFEAVIAKLRDALQKSDKPERRAQAASWKVFRAAEPGANGSVLYLFTIDPAVKGADYTVSNILAEAFPEEVQALYKQFADSYAGGQNFVNLSLVTQLGQNGAQ